MTQHLKPMIRPLTTTPTSGVVSGAKKKQRNVTMPVPRGRVSSATVNAHLAKSPATAGVLSNDARQIATSLTDKPTMANDYLLPTGCLRLVTQNMCVTERHKIVP